MHSKKICRYSNVHQCYTVHLEVHGRREIANLMIKTLCKSQLYRELSAANHGAFSALHHGTEVGIKSGVCVMGVLVFISIGKIIPD